jgi:thiazole synthase
MLNINLQTSAKLAYEKTKLAYDMSGERLIKLEVLGGDYKHSNQNEIVVAARDIIRWNSSLNVYPLLENDLLTAKKLIDVGCKLLRVMGSGIGTGEGIKDIKTLAKICELGVPVIIDGGIGSLDDAKQALEVGVDGILVNSMLFEQIEPPEVVLKDFKNLFK